MFSKRKSLLAKLTVLLVMILGCLLTLIYVAPAKMVSGSGDNLNIYGVVEVWGLGYTEPHTTSSHRFGIDNYSNLDLRYTYEFQHAVLETGEEDKELVENIELPASGTSKNGEQGLDVVLIDGEDYTLDAYTRIHVWNADNEAMADRWKVADRIIFWHWDNP